MPLEFRPNPEKIVELLLYLAHAQPGADVYHAVKMFYLADREHLIRHGRPITQEAYVAMDYGPVASTVLDLFNGNKFTMRQHGIRELPFSIERRERTGKGPVAYLGAPKREVDRSVFSKSDLKVFDEVLAKFGNKSFQELFKLTHKHEAYVRAWNERGGRNASPMRYDEMIESKEQRERLLEDVGPLSHWF
jgi:uncharacterized phage-associated protein